MVAPEGGSSGAWDNPDRVRELERRDDADGKDDVGGRGAAVAPAGKVDEVRPASLVKNTSSFRLYQTTSASVGSSSTTELEALIKDMADNIDDETIVCKGTVVLSQLAARSNSQRMGRSFIGVDRTMPAAHTMANGEIGRLGGLQPLVDALRRHMDSRRVVMKVVFALENILDSPENNHTWKAIGGDEQLAVVAKRWRGDKDIRESLKKTRPHLVGGGCCAIM